MTTLVVFLGVCLAAGFVTLAVALTLGRVLDARDAQVPRDDRDGDLHETYHSDPNQWYDPRPACVCGHPAGTHEHYRAGSDCGQCGRGKCPEYQDAP